MYSFLTLCPPNDDKIYSLSPNLKRILLLACFVISYASHFAFSLISLHSAILKFKFNFKRLSCPLPPRFSSAALSPDFYARSLHNPSRIKFGCMSTRWIEVLYENTFDQHHIVFFQHRRCGMIPSNCRSCCYSIRLQNPIMCYTSKALQLYCNICQHGCHCVSNLYKSAAPTLMVLYFNSSQNQPYLGERKSIWFARV